MNDFIKENIGKLRIGSQWANCEESGRKQLHIFSAAPSFQKQAGYINWNEDFENKELYKSICTEIVKAQYKALAQIAAIKSAKTGKTAIMHVFQVGQGAFYNPPEVMDDVLKAIDEELRGFDVEVILHQRGTPKNPWNEVASKAKINLKK